MGNRTEKITMPKRRVFSLFNLNFPEIQNRTTPVKTAIGIVINIDFGR
jgi:hypothetical protein